METDSENPVILSFEPLKPPRTGEAEAVDERTRVQLQPPSDPPPQAKRRIGRPRGAKGAKRLEELSAPEKRYLGIRHTIEQWLGLRTMYPGLSHKEIAERMGMTSDGLYKAIRKARDRGVLEIHEPMEKLKYEVIPQAMDNLSQLLKEKDKAATLETVKNTVFKQFQTAEGIQEQPNMVLGIKIDMSGADESKLATGQIMGKPRVLIPDDATDELA